MPHWFGQRGQRRRHVGADASLSVRGGEARGGEFVASQRRGYGRVDEAFLSRDAGRTASGSGRRFARGAACDVAQQALAGALLLGGVRAAGGMVKVEESNERWR